MFNATQLKPAARGTSRRQLLKGLGIAGAAAVGTGLLGKQRSAEAALSVTYGAAGHKFAVTDLDILNFALNLEYLEAEFYQNAVNGSGLTTADSTPGGAANTGTMGTTTIKANPAVPFANDLVHQYATEIAADELNHVQFLRAALGKHAVARPNINFTDTFNVLAAAAGIASTFDPFASDDAFLLGAFVFEDVGVTAYNGAAAYIKSPAYLSAAAKILTVEGYHAGSVRTSLYNRGSYASSSTAFDIEDANKIAYTRDMLSKAAQANVNDEGIAFAGPVPNIVPANGNGEVYARTFTAVLNIVYGNTTTTPGGFFPSGLNGRIK